MYPILMRMEHMRWWGGHGMRLLWIALIVLVVVFILLLAARGLQSKDEEKAGSSGETPMDILKKRYARGEIDDEEFERRKKRLEED